MTEMFDAPLLENEVQLTSQHRVSFDRYNKTLSFRYRKRNGKGRNAEYSNEYGYGNERYYSSFEHLSKRLLDSEFDEFLMQEISESEKKDLQTFVEAIEKVYAHIDKVAAEIAKNLNEKIVINIESKKKPKQVAKGMVIDDEDDGDED